MRTLPLAKIKFLSGRACVNRPDGAKMVIIVRHPVNFSYPLLGNHPRPPEFPRTYHVEVRLKDRPGPVFMVYDQEALMVQALITAFRQGEKFGEEVA